MSDLASIEANVNWIQRETRRRPSRARARELLGRLRFEQRQLARLAGDQPSTLNPQPA